MTRLQATDVSDFVPFRILRTAPVAPRDDVLVFVAFCPDGLLTPLQILCLQSYHSEGYRLALVINSGADDHGIDPGHNPAVIQIVRENIGFDFGGWGHAVRIIGDLSAAKSVTFANDSLVGPLPGDGNGNLRGVVEETPGDVVFMTESLQIQPHGQSYFFALKQSAIAKGALQVVRSSLYYSEKKRVVLNEEVTLMARFKDKGLDIGISFPCPQALGQGINPTFFFWDYLVSTGFPFVKVSLVPDGKVSIDDAELAAVIGPKFLQALRQHLSRRPVPAPLFLSSQHGDIRR